MTPPEQLILTFNSDVDPPSCDISLLTLQSTSTAETDGTISFQGGSCQYLSNSTTFESVDLVLEDWGSVQRNIKVATTAENSYISLSSGFIRNANGTANVEVSSSNALKVSTFQENVNPPSVTSTTLDLNLGLLTLSLTEAVDLSTLDVTGFIVHYLSRFNMESGNLTLTSAAQVSVSSLGILSIQLIVSDFLDLKINSLSNYSLSIGMGTFVDGNSMSNLQQTALPFDTVLPDVTPPSLDFYTLDLNTGDMSLSFSEPLNSQTFNPDGITIVGASRNSFNLSPSTTVTNVQMHNTLLTLSISYPQLNLIKIYATTGGVTLTLVSSAVTDTSGNPVTPIPIASSLKPGTIIPDSTPPRLIQFIPGTPEEQQVTYIFDENVSTESWTGAGVVYTLTDSTQIENVYSGFSKGTLQPEISDTIIYSFSASDLTATFSEHYASAYNGGSFLLQVGTGLISDLSGNRLVAPSSPLMFVAGPDTDRPRLLSFILDMNKGEIMMTFSEPVLIVSTSRQITLQDTSRQPNATYTLIHNASVSPQTPSDEITLAIESRDLNAVKINPNLATSMDDTYLVLLETFANDSSGNMLIEDLNGTQASRFIPDTTPPELMSFNLDLNNGFILVVFSEPISQTIDFSEIFITHSLQNTPSGISIAGGMVNSTAEQSTSITILISEIVLNMVKSDVTVCTSSGNCYLFLNSGSVSDLFGNSLQSGQRSAISSLVPDTTRPELTAYAVDLNQGYLFLTFSEPVNVSDFDSTGLLLIGTISQSNFSLEIDLGLLDSRELNSIMSLTLQPSSLNQLKLVRALDNIALAIDSGTISDTSGNIVAEISSSSSLQPSLVVQDTTSPSLLNFIARPPEDKRISLIFDEPVNSSTWDGTKLIITFNTRQGSIAYNNFNQGSVTPAYSESIKYSFADTEFNSTFAQQYTDAFYTGYLALSANDGLIADLSFNPLLSIQSPLLANNGSDFPDLIRPTLISFNLDLNSGTLEMTFSENVTNIQVPGQVQLRNNPTSNTSYTMTAEGTIIVDRISPHIVDLVMDITDLNNLKSINNLATSVENTYLVLLEDFTSDENGNLLMPLQNGLQVSNFFQDIERPLLLSFDMDIDSGALSMYFNEPVSTTIQYDQIYITGSLQNTRGGINITGSSVTSTLSCLIVTISDPVLNAVKADTNICTGRSNCLLFLTETAVYDTSGNPLLPPPTSSLVANFTADTSRPELISYSIDLDSGQMELTFNEPTIAASFDPFGIILLGSAGSSVTLNDVVLSTQSTDLFLTLSIGSMPLNQLKFLHVTESVQLTIESYTITDTAGNMILEIPPTSPLPPSAIVEDSTQPSLINFIPGPPEDMQIMFVFNEYVNASTWDGTRVSLTLSTPNEENIYSVFVEGQLLPSVSDTIKYNFSEAEFNASFSALYAEAYANYSISLFTQGGLVNDLNSNPLLGLTTPLVFSQVDNIRPILLNFTLDLNIGSLRLTFSEEIIIRSVSGHVRLQNDPIQPSSVYTLTKNGTVNIQAEVAVIMIDRLDLNNIKYNRNLVTSVANTYLFLLEPFAVDTSGNVLEFQQNATEAEVFIEDASGPEVIQFDLDLDSNIMSLQFNEPVLVATFNHMLISLTNTSNGDNSNREVVPLTSVEVIAEFNSVLTSFRILLGINDSVIVKRTPLCYRGDNCFALFQSGLISDIYSNPLLATNTSVRVNTLLADVTPPRLVAFTQFDLDSGLFTLIFSEPVNSSSTDFTDVQFINSLRNPTINVTLSEGFTTPDHIEIDFQMTREDLNMIKITQMLCTRRDDCWIRLPSFFINDIGMNPFLHSNYQPDAQASFHQPLGFILDTTPPDLETFSVDMNVGNLVLSFSEVVLSNSFLPNAITLLGSRDDSVTLTLSTQSMFARSTEGDEVTVQFTLSDINSLKAQDLYKSMNDSFVTITEGLLDTSSNILETVFPIHAIRVSVYTRDFTQPLVVSFDEFNREIGSLVLSFNEPIDTDSIQFNYLSLLSAPNSTSRYNLTGGEVMYVDESKLSISITLSKFDRIRIKTIVDLAVNEESTYISLLEGFIEDTSGNVCEEVNETHPLILTAGQFIEDTIRASLNDYTLDLNTGVITLSFDDVLNASSIDVTSLTLQNAVTNHNSNTTHTLSRDSHILSDNADVVTLALSEKDLNSLKLNLKLASDSSNTFISFDSSFATDIEGKPIVSVTQDNAAMVSTYIQDSTRARLSSFDLDMNTGLMQLTFSEPILVSSVLPNQLAFHNNKSLQESVMYGLRNSTVLTVSVTSLSILINITYDDLNQLKGLSDLASNRLNTFISVTSNFVSDTNDNEIEESSNMVAVFLQDTTSPRLLFFDMQLTSTAVLTLQFSEAVAVNVNSSSFFTVQNHVSNPSITLPLSPIDTITQPSLDKVQITLRLSYTTRLLTDTSIGSSVDTLFLSLAPGGVMDHNRNDAVPVLVSNALRVRLFGKFILVSPYASSAHAHFICCRVLFLLEWEQGLMYSA